MDMFDTIKLNALNYDRATPINEAGYDYALSVLPPVRTEFGFWAMGEVHSHTESGQEVYYWFAQFARKQFYAFLGTLEAAKKAFFDERVFCGVFPAGIVWADRKQEQHGDYKRLAFLPYDTLELKVEKSCPAHLVSQIEEDAKRIQERKGQSFPISTSGNASVVLGGQLI